MQQQSHKQQQDFKKCGDLDVSSGRVATQLGWYKFAASFCRGHKVLDVGSGLGEGMKILSSTAEDVFGLEVDKQLEGPKVMIKDLSAVDSASFDSLVCIDVIEHIEKDVSFAKDLTRVAKNQVLVSTPNWTASRCQWPYHVREYTPQQLVGLFKQYGKVTLYKGEPSGDRSYQVRFPRIYYIMNALRSFPPTSFLTRCINAVLPQSCKINSHLFVRVQMSEF
ncbi:class I SAM-dependent methyltransferase [Planctomycetaceae bacterium SH139]